MSNPNQKPRTPYVHFLMDATHRDALKAQHPTAKFGELSGLLGQKWKAMDADERAPYLKKAEAERSTYRHLLRSER